MLGGIRQGRLFATINRMATNNATAPATQNAGMHINGLDSSATLPSKDQSESRFMRLPTELRLQILRKLLVRGEIEARTNYNNRAPAPARQLRRTPAREGRMRQEEV